MFNYLIGGALGSRASAATPRLPRFAIPPPSFAGRRAVLRGQIGACPGDARCRSPTYLPRAALASPASSPTITKAGAEIPKLAAFAEKVGSILNLGAAFAVKAGSILN